MNDIKFYFTNYVEEEEIKNVTFPTVFKDVMDGTYDTGSLEFYLTSEEYNKYKNTKLKEMEFIRRKIFKNDEIVDDRVFLINEFAAEKDSLFDEAIYKITISYVEATKLLETYLMPNHTYSVKNLDYSEYSSFIPKDEYENMNTLYDEYYVKYFLNNCKTWYNLDSDYINMLYERNYQNYISTNKYRKFDLDDELKDILKQFPNKSCTYVDYNFMDITTEKFTAFNSVPYLDALNGKLTYISGFGKEKNLVLDANDDHIIVNSNYNRNTSNNADLLENKAENIICDYEEVWYPINVNMEAVLDNFGRLNTNLQYFVRPRGLNEGLEEYSSWPSWYLELPSAIDRVTNMIVMDMNITNTTSPKNENAIFKIGADYIVEDSVYSKLTETEKKYYAHYKRGDNKIYNIVQTLISYEDNAWPWDNIEDNAIALNVMFSVKYKPMISTDITVIGENLAFTNKKNIVIDNRNTSDTDLIAKTQYELEKRQYGEYVIQIAGEYQNIEAGDLVEFKNFSNYGIEDKKYLIYRVETTFEKEGSYQTIYFNEMVAKNNVLINLDNRVRITENNGTNQLVDRVLKFTDAININIDKVDEKQSTPNIYNSKNAKPHFLFGSLKRLFGLSDYSTAAQLDLRQQNISAMQLYCSYEWLKNENGIMKPSLGTSNDYLAKQCYHLNSGTISQSIFAPVDNVTFEYEGQANNKGTFSKSVPILYSNTLGLFNAIDINFTDQTNFYSRETTHEDILGGLDKYTFYYSSSYPHVSGAVGEEYSNVVINGVPTQVKDTRDILKIVYEQTYYSKNSNIKLSNYFTSTTNSFGQRTDYGNIYDVKPVLERKNLKDILIFDKKIYNVNVINEDDAIIKIDNASEYLSYENDNVFLDISSFGLVGEYTIVIRGVINSNLITSEDSPVKMVPQLSYYDNFTSDDKYLRFSLEVDKIY